VGLCFQLLQKIQSDRDGQIGLCHQPGAASVVCLTYYYCFELNLYGANVNVKVPDLSLAYISSFDISDVEQKHYVGNKSLQDKSYACKSQKEQCNI